MATSVPGDDGRDAPILVELRQRLDLTHDPIERATLRLRQGLYLARTNRWAEARAIPDEVRSGWNGQEQLRVFVWLWILEGVLAFYETSATGGRIRLTQAREAARQAGFEAEAQLASAWLAHLDYVDNRFDEMLEALRASRLDGALLDETRARAALTLACALQLCGEHTLANDWFASARERSRLIGDRAGIMAATANRLMLKLNDNWLAFAFGERVPHDTAGLRQELHAILGYERLSGSESLREQNELSMLRLAVLRGDETGALGVARDMSAARDRRSRPALAMASVVEHWLAGRTPDAAVAREHLQAATALLQDVALDDDDSASCWALVAQLARAAGSEAQAEAALGHAQAARQRFVDDSEHVRPALRAMAQEAKASWPTV